MARAARIPDVAVKRLPVYLRALAELQAAEVEIVSSAELAQRTGFSSEQIRKDLAYFGSFGTRGVGYSTESLAHGIRRVLGLDHAVEGVLVGAGHLGTALARYNLNREQHVNLVAIFDADPTKVGEVIGDARVLPVSEMPSLIRERRVRLAVVAVPAGVAQTVVDDLVEAGVLALLNFAPVKLSVPRHVQVQNIDLSLELQALAYYLTADPGADPPPAVPRGRVPPVPRPRSPRSPGAPKPARLTP